MLAPFISVDKQLRPYLWGFFISLAFLILLTAARSGCAYLLENQLAGKTSAQRAELIGHIEKRFRERIAALFKIAGTVAQDQQLVHLLGERDPTSLAALFDGLNRHRRPEDMTIDLVDSQGTIVAWAGRSVVSDYGSILASNTRDSVVAISQSGLQRNLSVVFALPARRFFVTVSRPLETNYPLSNRFVTRSSFAEDLSQEFGSTIRMVFELSTRDTVSGSMFAIPLNDLRGRSLAYVLAPVPTVASELSAWTGLFGKWQGAVIALASIFLAVVLYRRFRSFRSPLARILLVSVVLWGVRLAWRETDVPSMLIGGFLFDPSVYASPFVLRLASSLGELLLSCVVLFLNVLLVVSEFFRWWASRSPETREVSVGKKAASALLMVGLALASPWIVRGFGAALRSFVFDSTVRYQDPSSIVPDVSVLLMHVNILLLVLSLLLVFVAIVMSLVHLVSILFLGEGRSPRSYGVVLVILLAGYGVFLLVNKVPQTPAYYPPLVFVFTLCLAWWIGARAIGGYSWRSPSFRQMMFIGGVVFVLSALLLDMWQIEKERARVQVLADESLRPADNWLSFVVSDGIRSVALGASEALSEGSGEPSQASNLAFVLWVQTLMSREGYNSAIYLYDADGKEFSRFSVGLDTYEQGELLRKVFETDEEVLHVLERTLPGGTIKYYGEWGSILDEEGSHLGTVAVMLSASRRTLFRGEAPEPLRTGSREQLDEIFRKVSLSEYQAGSLVSTTDPMLFRGMKLPSDAESKLSSPENRYFWSRYDLGGQAYDVLYATDESNGQRVLALIWPSPDIRWHAFNLVKMLAVYVFFFGAGASVHIGWSSLRRASVKLGFREKLVSSFAVLSILPLLLMAYYNRELAVERLDENITQRLAEDLDIINQRITNSVLDEQDFYIGIHDDYCEVASADLGVDFSVFNGSVLQASSRPELYRSAILDSRLSGTAFVNTMMLGKGFSRDFERIGTVGYLVGYRPIVVGNRVLGALVVPALYRQREVDEELAQRNAFVLGAYAVVVVLVVAISFLLANRLSRPLRELSLAAQDIGKGNMEVRLKARSEDEVGDLVRSFNEMTTELKASRENLARVEREVAWKEMAKQVAHEIKNPLTPIKLSIQHLLQAYRDRAHDFERILQGVSTTVIEQIEVLTRIASEFADFARMPERKFERVDVRLLLQETVTLFRELQGIEFRSKFSDTPAILIADRDELRRVFINIIRNSVQAMDKGGTITIETSVADQICTIIVSDTGSGIPPELQARVFRPNFSTKTEGMGLGLAIAQKVIEDLNGTIALRSEVGKGTSVEMKIPLKLG